MIRPSFLRLTIGVLVAGAVAAACSSNAGFGTPPPVGTQPQSNGTPIVVSPSPSGSETPEPSPTPPTPLNVDSASARLAYDASAADPVKAARLVEVTFALDNPTAAPMAVSSVAIAADANPAAKVPLSLQALGNQDTVETLVAVAPPKDYSKTKTLTLTFADAKGTLLAQDGIDFPDGDDFAVTPLDKSHAAGGLSVDDIAVTNIIAPGKGQHFDVTFTVTNAGNAKISIAQFVVTPPKGDPIKVMVPLAMPQRTTTAPVSMVVPFDGKALPQGKYSVSASDGTNPLAIGSGPLL